MSSKEKLARLLPIATITMPGEVCWIYPAGNGLQAGAEFGTRNEKGCGRYITDFSDVSAPMMRAANALLAALT